MKKPAGKTALVLPEGYADWLARLRGQMAGKPLFKFSFKEDVGIKLCFNTVIGF